MYALILKRLALAPARLILAISSVFLVMAAMVWIEMQVSSIDSRVERASLFAGGTLYRVQKDPDRLGYYDLAAPYIDPFSVRTVATSGDTAIFFLADPVDTQFELEQGGRKHAVAVAFNSKALPSGTAHCIILGREAARPAVGSVSFLPGVDCALIDVPSEWRSADIITTGEVLVLPADIAAGVLGESWRWKIEQIYIAAEGGVEEEGLALVKTLASPLRVTTPGRSSVSPEDSRNRAALKGAAWMVAVIGSGVVALCFLFLLAGQFRLTLRELGLLQVLGRSPNLVLWFIVQDVSLQALIVASPLVLSFGAVEILGTFDQASGLVLPMAVSMAVVAIAYIAFQLINIKSVEPGALTKG